MDSVAWQIFVLFLLIMANGVFAMAELAIASSRRIRLRHRAEGGDAGARAALALVNDPGRFLSTVQIGITLIGILIGAFGSARLGPPLASWLETAPFIASYSEVLSVGIVVLTTTYLSLVIGELVPKQLALGNPEGIAARVARPMQLLSALTSPAVRLLSSSTVAVVRLLRIRPSSEPAVTEDEIRLLIEEGTAAGVFHPAEQDVVERVFRLDDLDVADLMTPRLRIIWLDLGAEPDEIRSVMITSLHQHFPVCRGDLDEVAGVVSVKDVWVQEVSGGPFDLEAIMRPPLIVPETMSTYRVLEEFRRARSTLALVVDEFGSIEGLVTLTDLIEALVGNFPAERSGDPRAVRRSDGSWLLDGMLPINDFIQIAHPSRRVVDIRGDYQTLGGLVLAQLGRIPQAGESFTLGGLRFEVMDMDGHRVDKVLVSELPNEVDTPMMPPDTQHG